MRPWEPMGICTADWLRIKPSRVLVDSIIPTQSQLSLPALVQREPSYCGDEYPHCVLWDGGLYLNDGHHRWIRAVIERDVTMLVRVAVHLTHFGKVAA